MSKSNRFNPHTREKEKVHRGGSFSRKRENTCSDTPPSGRDAIVIVESKYNPDNSALHNKRKTYEQLIVEGRFNKEVIQNHEPVVRDVRETDKRTFMDRLQEIRETQQSVSNRSSQIRSKIRPFERK